MQDSSWHLTDISKIRHILCEPDPHDEGNRWNISADGVVSAKRNTNVTFPWNTIDAVFHELPADRLPFKFKSFGEHFSLVSNSVTDISGAPIYGDVLIVRGEVLKTAKGLEGMFRKIIIGSPAMTRFDCNAKIDTVVIAEMADFDIADFASSISANNRPMLLEFIGAGICSIVGKPLLSLFKSRTLGGINSRHSNFGNLLEGPETQMALDIVDRHLQVNRDVLACQEEMIMTGLKRYARF